MASDSFVMAEVTGVINNQGQLDGVDKTGSGFEAITGNGSFTLGVSNEITNNGTYNSIEIVVEFCNLLARDTHLDANITPNVLIRPIIEAKIADGTWVEIAASFDPLTFLEDNVLGQKHVILVQPNVFNIDEGVPVDVWDGTRVVSRLSRQQNILNERARVRFTIQENAHNTPQEFKSVELKVNGVKYNV